MQAWSPFAKHITAELGALRILPEEIRVICDKWLGKVLPTI